MKHTLALSLLAVAAVSLTSPAFAQSAGEWTLGVGAAGVVPKSDNGHLFGYGDNTDSEYLPYKTEVGSNIRPTVTFEYFLADNLGVEVLGAWPFKHEISLQGVGRVAETKQLPPVVSLQYHFANSTRFTPFVGLGINYTLFYDTDPKKGGILDGTEIDLKNSWGLAGHVGLDYAINDHSAVRVDARYINIDPKVSIEQHVGSGINYLYEGTANIDPMVYGVSYIMKF